MDKKTLLAFFLIALILILTPYYYRIISPPADLDGLKTVREKKEINAVEKKEIDPVFPSKNLLPDNPPKPLSINNTGEELVHVSTPLYDATISNKSGGSIKSFKLKDYDNHFGGYVNLITPELNTNNLVLSFKDLDGDVIYLDNNFLLKPNTTYRDTLVAQDEDIRLDFTTTVAGESITKSLIFHPDSYIIDISVDLTNISYQNISLEKFQVNWIGGLPFTEKNKRDDVTYFAAHLYQGGELSKHSGKNGKPLTGTGKTSWTAIRSKYFTSAFISNGDGNYGYISMDPKNNHKNGIISAPKYNMTIGFPSNKPIDFSLYLGPLKYKYLKDLEVDLDKTMNFGWAFIQPISHGILFLLTFMYRFIPNYGILLIIFAVVIKIIVYPLTKKSYKSTKEMQAIQPLITTLRDKYKGDPQRLNKETMKLYKEHGVNPLGGCLPMLLQMPLLFALFIVFRTTIELRSAPFVWWIKDLSAPDTLFYLPFTVPIYGDQVSLLPIFMGISMFVQQKMMGTQSTGQQKYMAYFMTGFFLLLFNNFPSGLNLYYTLFNVLTILQQKYLVHPSQADSSLSLKTH